MEFAELIKTTRVDGVVLSCPGLKPVTGTLCTTSHHLLLSSQRVGCGGQSQKELWLLICTVDATEKRLANASGAITLKCKDLKVLHLEIPGMEECLNAASSIEVHKTHKQPVFLGTQLMLCRIHEGKCPLQS
uniref:MTMR6-9 GRAM domain-containing protein n=1 Tax=Varanus komodoensis TaxID=61221 RepID=A0A8D2PZ54_VARKO